MLCHQNTRHVLWVSRVQNILDTLWLHVDPNQNAKDVGSHPLANLKFLVLPLFIMPQGIFRCSPHDFESTAKKSPADQEDENYQHLRDEEHEVTYSKPCQNCTKKTSGKTKGKVPQPTPDVKNPKSIIVFCSAKCKKEYLAKLGVAP